MSLECEFCKKTYSNKSNLKNHQKTARYCLEIQKQVHDLEKINCITYDCKYCKKQYSTNQRLTKHTLVCLDKHKYELNQKNLENFQLKEENEILKEKVKTIELETENRILREHSKDNQSTINEIAKQPRVQTNNNQKILITTPIDMSKPVIQHAIQHNFSDEYLIQGQKGVARFAFDNILKDENGKLTYICTDPSRQVFQFKDEDGMVQKDFRATKLTKALLEAEIKASSHKIAWDKMKDGDDVEFQTYTDHYYEIKDLETDNTTFSKELATLTV